MLTILHSVVQTMAWYGLEFSGKIAKRNQEIDSFMYEAIKRLLDMPTATLHRACSAEFARHPSSIQHQYLVERICHRHNRHPEIMTQTGITPIEDEDPPSQTEEELAHPWRIEVPAPGGPAIGKIPEGYPTDLTSLEQKLTANDVIVYTDGPHPSTKTSYAAVAINPSTGTEITNQSGTLSGGKTIADAETYALYQAMLLAMDLRDNLTRHEVD